LFQYLYNHHNASIIGDPNVGYGTLPTCVYCQRGIIWRSNISFTVLFTNVNNMCVNIYDKDVACPNVENKC